MLTGIIAGCITGGICGAVAFIALCLCKSAGDADEEMERLMKPKNGRDGDENGKKS